ncbi:hypothetical protein OsI_37027 [Oryza sativa Indica Group]|uniref:Uncharacterized protein n=1 Tax=Oryza sativa subsp. indica TaxID=39946 RepID=B8BIK0_ORYSI|nr:hypothetical protein OsI_37027 [Oryza sativa Indica Group]
MCCLHNYIEECQLATSGKIRPDLIRAQTFPDGLMERMAETFPEYEQLFHVHRQA